MEEKEVIPQTVEKKKLDTDTANEYTTKILKLKQKEIGHFHDARANERDSDDRLSDLEDGYLANMQMIKLAKKFPKEQYEEYQLERPCGMSFETLEVPEWDDYIS